MLPLEFSSNELQTQSWTILVPNIRWQACSLGTIRSTQPLLLISSELGNDEQKIIITVKKTIPRWITGCNLTTSQSWQFKSLPWVVSLRRLYYSESCRCWFNCAQQLVHVHQIVCFSLFTQPLLVLQRCLKQLAVAERAVTTHAHTFCYILLWLRACKTISFVPPMENSIP